MNTQQLKSVGIKGQISFSNELGIISINSTCGKTIVFNSFYERTKAAKKLNRMGIHFIESSYFDTEEFEGLCQAGSLGLKTFECTILSR